MVMGPQEFADFVTSALISDQPIGIDDDLEATALFDSTGVLMMIAAIDKKFEFQLQPTDFRECKTPRDIYNLVSEKNNV